MAKEILYRIEFEGAKQQLDNLDKIADELARIQIEQQKLNQDDKKTAQQKAREFELLKAAAAERQQALTRERRALVDQQKTLRATSGTLEELRLRAKRLGQELERGPKVGSKEFQRLANEIREVNTQIQSADKSAGNFKSSIGNYRDAVRGLGGALGVTLSAGALIAGGKAMIDAYDKQIKAETALLTAVKGRSDVQKALLDQATQLQQKTIFGDERIIEVQAFAASMGLTRGQIEKLIPAALNLSTVTGMDLNAAVKNLAKSYSGLAGELGEAIPALRNLTKEQLQAGEAINLVNELMGGQAEAAALVGSGAIVQATNAWGDFTEILGKLIATNTSGFFASLTRELYSLNTVLSSETISTFQKLNALISMSAREELRIRDSIIKKRLEEIGLSNKERIEALDLGWQKIDASKKELELREQIKVEKQKEAELERQKAAQANAAAMQKALAAELELLKKIGEQLQTNATTQIRAIMASGMTGNTTQQTAAALAASRRAGVTVEDEAYVDDIPFNTEEIANRSGQGFDVEATTNAAAQFVDIWGMAYDQKAEKLKESLDKGLISEQKYYKETEKLQKRANNMQRISTIAQLTGDLAKTLSALGVGAANTAKIGFPQNIPMLLAFAAQAAGIVMNLKSIKFAEGGLIAGGKPHSQGGTKFVGSDGSAFEAEQGEYIAVVNKHDTKRLGELSHLNSKHGRPFYNQPASAYFAAGGMFMPNANMANSNNDALIRSIVKQIGSIPVEVSLNEIERKSDYKRKVNAIGGL